MRRIFKEISHNITSTHLLILMENDRHLRDKIELLEKELVSLSAAIKSLKEDK